MIIMDEMIDAFIRAGDEATGPLRQRVATILAAAIAASPVPDMLAALKYARLMLLAHSDFGAVEDLRKVIAKAEGHTEATAELEAEKGRVSEIVSGYTQTVRPIDECLRIMGGRIAELEAENATIEAENTRLHTTLLKLEQADRECAVATERG
jgi:hypothetical protein